MKTQKSAKVAAVCLIEGLESRQFLTVTTDTTVPTDVIMSDPGVIVGLPIDTGTTDTGSTDSGSTDGGVMTDPTLNSDPTGALMDGSSDGSGTADVPGQGRPGEPQNLSVNWTATRLLQTRVSAPWRSRLYCTLTWA